MEATAERTEELTFEETQGRAAFQDMVAFLRSPTEEARQARLVLLEILTEQIGEWSEEGHACRRAFGVQSRGMSSDQVHTLLEVSEVVKSYKIKLEHRITTLSPWARESEAHRYLGFLASALRSDIATYMSFWQEVDTDGKRGLLARIIDFLRKHTEDDHWVEVIYLQFPGLVNGVAQSDLAQENQ